jgi:hypothetical protein
MLRNIDQAVSVDFGGAGRDILCRYRNEYGSDCARHYIWVVSAPFSSIVEVVELMRFS